jgi:hypothetical protein
MNMAAVVMEGSLLPLHGTDRGSRSWSCAICYSCGIHFGCSGFDNEPISISEGNDYKLVAVRFYERISVRITRA